MGILLDILGILFCLVVAVAWFFSFLVTFRGPGRVIKEKPAGKHPVYYCTKCLRVNDISCACSFCGGEMAELEFYHDQPPCERNA